MSGPVCLEHRLASILKIKTLDIVGESIFVKNCFFRGSLHQSVFIFSISGTINPDRSCI